MPIQNEHPRLPSQPTDRSSQQVASPQTSHKHPDVMEDKWPSERESDAVSALMQLRKFPVIFSSASPQQEERHAPVAAAEIEQQQGIDPLEKNRVSAEAGVADRASSGSPGDPEFFVEEVVSDRNGRGHAVAYVPRKSRSKSLVSRAAGPNNTLSVSARKQKAALGCWKSEGFSGQAQSSVGTAVAAVTNSKSPNSGACKPHTCQQPSQPLCAMEDGKDGWCTRPAQAALGSWESYESLNGTESWKKASLEVGVPSSSAFGITRARWELALTHPPQGTTMPDEADPSFEPALSKQAGLELLGLRPRGRSRRARAEVEEANPPFFYVASARVLEDAGDTEMSWGPLVDEELPFNDNREFVKAKSMTALLKFCDDQEEQEQ